MNVRSTILVYAFKEISKNKLFNVGIQIMCTLVCFFSNETVLFPSCKGEGFILKKFYGW